MHEVRGATSIGRCTLRIFQWLQAAPKGIVEPKYECVVKRRKVQQQKKKGPGGVSSPTSPRGATGTVVDDRHPTELSYVTLTYGRPQLHLTDQCFVADDGRIVLVIRRLVEMPTGEGVDVAAQTAERANFFFKAKPRVNATLQRLPVLDYSFKDVTDLKVLTHRAPKHGAVHRVAGVEVPKEKEQSDRPDIKGGGKDGKNNKVITARGQDGREEAYAVPKDNDAALQKLADTDTSDDKKEETLEQLLEHIETKYETECVRLCNNDLVDCADLLKLLRGVCVNYYLTISWLDISCNHLVNVPNALATLPLTTLYLHANEISSWDEVKKITTLPRLATVTLHGNPIAQKTPDYKLVALSILLGAPARTVPLKSLDFVSLSAVDVQLTGMHVRVHQKDRSIPKLDPKTAVKIPVGGEPPIVKGPQLPGQATLQPLHKPKPPPPAKQQLSLTRYRRPKPKQEAAEVPAAEF